MDFARSKTRENLMRAFCRREPGAQPLHLRRLPGQKEKLHVIEGIFTFTANQEKEHAEIFYNLLTEYAGRTSWWTASTRWTSPSLLDLLKMARHNGAEEYEDVYASFAQSRSAGRALPRSPTPSRRSRPSRRPTATASGASPTMETGALLPRRAAAPGCA